MSIDRSLKIKGALSRHRNVLKRGERIEHLKDEERWSEDDSVFGLPKVSHRKSHAGRKEKKAPVAEPGIEATAEAEAEASKPTEQEG
jgi:small basic protein (TIGR04137 family)